MNFNICYKITDCFTKECVIGGSAKTTSSAIQDEYDSIGPRYDYSKGQKTTEDQGISPFVLLSCENSAEKPGDFFETQQNVFIAE